MHNTEETLNFEQKHKEDLQRLRRSFDYVQRNGKYAKS